MNFYLDSRMSHFLGIRHCDGFQRSVVNVKALLYCFRTVSVDSKVVRYLERLNECDDVQVMFLF